MTVTSLGTLTLGAALPGAATAAAEGSASIGFVLPDLQEKVAAIGIAVAQLSALPIPPDFAASVTLATQVLGAVQLAVNTPGLLPPSFDAAVGELLIQLAALNANLIAVQASAAAIAAVQAPLGVGNVQAFAFDGQRGALGGELGAALGSGAQPAHAVVLYTEQPATWTAMSAVLKVTP